MKKKETEWSIGRRRSEEEEQGKKSFINHPKFIKILENFKNLSFLKSIKKTFKIENFF